MSFISSNYKQQLDDHLIFKSLTNLNQLRAFMELHVYAVWDFMSLLKSLQALISPHGSPWFPNQNTQIVRLINEIVLEEESDLARPDVNDEYASHFEMYLSAMDEIGASTDGIKGFVAEVEARGIDDVLAAKLAPSPVQAFLESTFNTIRDGRVHEIASSFAYGRENLVPVMFTRILDNCEISSKQAPLFHHYLERHAHLDGEQHGPMADKLVSFLTDNDSIKIEEAKLVAVYSVQARLDLWDHVLSVMPKNERGD
jgi:hypothetical protein